MRKRPPNKDEYYRVENMYKLWTRLIIIDDFPRYYYCTEEREVIQLILKLDFGRLNRVPSE